MIGRGHGDSWRWDTNAHRSSGGSTISVIEPAEKREIPEGARVVPFGFSRVLCESADLPDVQNSGDGWDEHASMVAS